MRVAPLALVAVFFMTTCAGQGPLRVSLHPEIRHQKIYGFGASDAWRCQFVGKNWPLEKRAKIADLLFSREFDPHGNPLGIGLSIWRFYIGSGSTEQGDSSGIRDVWRRAECFQRKDGSYDWSKQQGQRWFLQAAKERGVETFLAFTISPPVHMALNGMAFNGSREHKLNIRPGKISGYAGFLADVVEHFYREEGILFDYISPVNEPQWLWERATQEGTPATNEDIFTLTRHLSEELAERSVPTRILVGEAGDIRYLYKTMNKHGNDRQIRELFGDGSIHDLSAMPAVHPAITGHSYFTTWPVDKMIEHRLALRDTLRAVDPNLEYWQTEFCILEKNDDIGGGHKRDLGMNTALYYARVIYHDLTLANASSWQFWTALSEADYKDGLIYLDAGDSGVSGDQHPGSVTLQHDGFFRESKTLWAFGNFSRFIRPGMHRVEVRYADKSLTRQDIAGNVMVSAFTSDQTKEIVIVAVNYSHDDSVIEVDNAQIFKRKNFRVFTTSDKGNLEPGTSPAGNLSIPARSVVTFIGELR